MLREHGFEEAEQRALADAGVADDEAVVAAFGVGEHDARFGVAPDEVVEVHGLTSNVILHQYQKEESTSPTHPPPSRSTRLGPTGARPYTRCGRHSAPA